MPSPVVQRFLDRLQKVRKSGAGWKAECPAHDDKTPSLNVKEGDDGRVVFYCHARCRWESICAAVGLRAADLFPQGNRPPGLGEIVAVYSYEDAAGQLLFEVVRFEGKEFRQRRPDGAGSWIWNRKGVEPVLYRLPAVAKAVSDGETICLVEGEKDVGALERLGLCSTTNPGGAGKWRRSYSEVLRGARIRMVPDNDDAGRTHAEEVFRSLNGIAAQVEIVEVPGLPDRGDISDWLAARQSEGKTPDEIRELIAGLPAHQAREAKSQNGGDEKKSQAQLLVEFVDGESLFHDHDGKGYADLAVNGHRETWPVRSTGFRSWLTRQFYLDHHKPPGSQALQDALGVLESKAQFDGLERAVYVRVGEHDGAVYLDLCNDGWEAVEITSDGWRVVSEPPVRFRRARGMESLPHPVAGGDMADFQRFANTGSEDDFILIVACLVAYLRPRGPYPILNVMGEHGSSKSTLQRVIRALVDPSTAPLRALSRSTRDLAITASNAWMVVFDNLSRMPAEISDALCRLSTGGGFSTRQLFTDAEEAIFDAQRPVLVNGIGDVMTRGDLMDRSVTVLLPPIPGHERRPEREFWADFEKARPRMLGAVLDAVSCALGRLEEIHLPEPPRMADFAQWVVAAEQALPWQSGAFLQAYTGNREMAIEVALESDPIAVAITDLVSSGGSFKGTMTALLDRLNETVDERTSSSKFWPTLPRSLTTRVRRAAPLLRDFGIEVGFEHSGQRYVILEKARTQPSRPSRPPKAESELDGVDDVDGRNQSLSTDTARATDVTSRPALLIHDPNDEVVA